MFVDKTLFCPRAVETRTDYADSQARRILSIKVVVIAQEGSSIRNVAIGIVE